jgi:hypothetical protein
MNAATRAKRLISAAAEGMKGFTPHPCIYVPATMARDCAKSQFSLIGTPRPFAFIPSARANFNELTPISAFIFASSTLHFVRARFPGAPIRLKICPSSLQPLRLSLVVLRSHARIE